MGCKRICDYLCGNAGQADGGRPYCGKHIRKPCVLDASWKRKNGGLSDVDRQVLGNLYFKANSVFEFGLGESTLIAAKTGVPRYSGVDSDPNWVSNTRKEAGMDHFRFYQRVALRAPLIRGSHNIPRSEAWVVSFRTNFCKISSVEVFTGQGDIPA